LDEDMQQYQQIIGLEFDNENLKEQIAAMKAGNFEAGSGDVMSERNKPTSKQNSLLLLSSKCGGSGGVFRR
jgi:hypothetical protein